MNAAVLISALTTAETVLQAERAAVEAERQRLAAEVVQFHEAHEKDRLEIETRMRSGLGKAWECGRRLVRLKALLRHGEWEEWATAQFPQISESSRQLYMRVALANPNAQRVGHLDEAPLRKYQCSFVTEKTRPEIEGDGRIAPAPSYLTGINSFVKAQQQCAIGLMSRPAPDVFRREAFPVALMLHDFGGEVWESGDTRVRIIVEKIT